jgi:hypothetical protein
MKRPADDVRSAFRALRSTAMGVFRRTGVWTAPTRLVRYAAEIRGAVPAALHEVLDDLLFGPGTRAGVAVSNAARPALRVPAQLVSSLQAHLHEFSRLYSLGRSDSSAYTYAMLKALDARWPRLAKQLDAAGVPAEVVQPIERYMLERLNHTLARLDERVRATTLRAAVTTTSSLPRGEAVWRKMLDWAHAGMRKKRRPIESFEDLPWSELDGFGKMCRLFPEGDPAWREIADVVAANSNAPKIVQGFIGELVALRTPGVVEFIEQQTREVLAGSADLVAQGWRVVIQPRSVMMPTLTEGVKVGKALPGGGVGGMGLSFDFSVWLVKDDTAMPVVRGQVKAGKVANAQAGVQQSTETDDWRGLGDIVEMLIDGKPKQFSLRPPDSYAVIRVLVVTDDTPIDVLQKAVPAGGTLNVFRMPMTATEFAAVSGAIQREFK